MSCPIDPECHSEPSEESCPCGFCSTKILRYAQNEKRTVLRIQKDYTHSDNRTVLLAIEKTVTKHKFYVF